MKRELLTILCVSLIVLLPVSSSVTLAAEEEDIRDTGESITINVKEYQPKVVTTEVLEENRIPVYAILQGTTIGSLTNIGEGSTEPIYSNPQIKDIGISTKEKSKEISSIRYVRPLSGTATLDNLGYLVITLDRIPKEHEVPGPNETEFGSTGKNALTAKLSARVYFYGTRINEFGSTDLNLKEYSDEELWKAHLDEHKFWDGLGYLRVKKINEDSVIVQVYDSLFHDLGTRTLREGQISSAFRLPVATDLLENSFRLQLNSLIDPSQKTASINVDINGEITKRILSEGDSIYPGSSFRIKEGGIVKVPYENEGQLLERVTITNSEGDEKTIQNINNLDVTFLTTFSKETTFKKGASTYSSLTELSKLLNKQISIPSELNNRQLIKDYKANPGSVIFDEITTIVLNEFKGYTIKVNKEGSILIEKITEESECNDGSDSCKSINEFKVLLDDQYASFKDPNTGLSYKDLANYWIGVIYSKLDKNDLAISYLEKTNHPDSKIALEGLYSKLGKSIEKKTLLFKENEKDVFLELLNVNLPESSLSSEATLTVEGKTNKYNQGDRLRDANGVELEAFVSNVQRDKVTIAIPTSEGKGNSEETIKLGKSTQINIKGKLTSISVTDINLKKKAQISIVPGDGRDIYSDSEFDIKIPIEKRSIQLTPEMIDKQINKTEEQIKKLDDIINKLEKTLKSWNAICLATFAFLTITNSFLNSAENIARKKVMSEDKIIDKDGKEYSGWNDYCQNHLSKNSWTKEEGKYSSTEDCIFANSENIESSIDKASEAVDQTNKEIKELGALSESTKTDYASKLASSQVSSDKISRLIEEKAIKQEDVKDVLYYKYVHPDQYENYLKQNYGKDLAIINRVDEQLKGTSLTGQDLKNYKQTLNFQAEKAWEEAEQAKLGNSVQSYKYQSSSMIQSITDIFNKNQPISSVYSNYKSKSSIENELNNKLKDSKVSVIDTVYTTAILGKTSYYVYDSKGKTNVEPLSSNGKNQITYEGNTYAYYIDKTNNQIYEVANQKNAYNFCTNYEEYFDQVQTDANNKLLTIPLKGQSIYNTKIYGESRQNLADYAQYTESGKLDGIYNCNTLVISADALKKEYPSLSKQLEDEYSKSNNKKSGSKINLGGVTYSVSDQLARSTTEKGKTKCTDVMSLSSCKMLFAVCDPVMCPTSRFNMNGRWNVDNVVKTGIIGSIFLGPWQDFPEEPVPVCLTGILAGLKGIRSVLQGYVECLKTARVNDMSVGICDKIRSIFVCEILWKEAIALFKIKGGIIDMVSKWILGQSEGGGEYLTFKESLNNVGESVSFFTTEYAKTAFAAYQARSTEEIGTEICKAAIFAKAPGAGDLMDQITKPESPAQYTATFSESVWSGMMGQSKYNVFYHIYAGEDTDARYSVYLTGPGLRPFYATEKCNGVMSSILKGGFADYNLDCIAPAGYTQLCIELNGKQECGFGKVSSSFALDWVNDKLVETEVNKKITSQGECESDDTIGGNSLSKLINVQSDSGILKTGIIRYCSSLNPGLGTNPDNWKKVGTCGEDEKGRSLGDCWIKLDSGSITSVNDAKLKEELTTEIETKNQEYLTKTISEEIKSIYEQFSKLNLRVEDTRILQNNIEVPNTEMSGLINTISPLITQIEGYEDLSKVAYVHYVLAVLYYKLALITLSQQTSETSVEEISEITTTTIPKTTTTTLTELKENIPESEEYFNALDITDECTLNKVYWSISSLAPSTGSIGALTEVKEGYTVYMIAETNCPEVLFKLYESDGMAMIDDSVNNRVIKCDGKSAILKWEATSQSGGLLSDLLGGDSEYYFTVKSKAKEDNILKSELLVVKK